LGPPAYLHTHITLTTMTFMSGLYIYLTTPTPRKLYDAFIAFSNGVLYTVAVEKMGLNTPLAFIFIVVVNLIDMRIAKYLFPSTKISVADETTKKND
jgi:hypothetical protein